MRTQSVAEKFHYDARVDSLLDELGRLQKSVKDLETENRMLRLLVPGSPEVASILHD